jgi:hypothetical protein
MARTSGTHINDPHQQNRQPAITLSMFWIGLLCAAGAGVLHAVPGMFPSLGPPDGLRLRLLRLAQVACIALPLLTLLYRGLMARVPLDIPLPRWGFRAMLGGMIGMPSLLAAAAVTRVEFKYLLQFPAVAMFAGTLCGAWLARRYARPVEHWGWVLIALSMAAGLLMGLYAFDGPLPSPAFIGDYNDPVRRVIRQAHTSTIVAGFISILISRGRATIGGYARAAWGGTP